MGTLIIGILIGALIGVAFAALAAAAARADKHLEELPGKPGEVHHDQ